MPDRVHVENGVGYSLAVCECGWREMVHTEAALQAAVCEHKSLYHGDPSGAAGYVYRRRTRGAS